ncbi:PaaI family thioesterase [Sphingomonas ginkgonis]|uniref:PaaI family thioesterase n=2 Tax=Sphingomonas ginkgonis TaxID=2315330 RepID=A0A3S0EPL0_9SPHN|nr:PaaI family thioesterase [Sphingomonas ginkgonis]
MARHVGHAKAIGLQFRAAGDDWVEMALPWRPELVAFSSSGIMASGPIVSLVDTCSGVSVWTALGAYRPSVTLDLRLDYLRPAVRGETVVARCHCTSITRQIAFVSGVAHGGDPDRPIARSAGTFMLDGV